MKWFDHPHQPCTIAGMPSVKTLLPPAIKWMFDTLVKFKGSYVGIADDQAFLYINDMSPIRIRAVSVGDVKELCDDVRVYNDLNEYRISESRKKDILLYYI